MENNKIYSRILNFILVLSVMFTLSISGALAGRGPVNYFWRTYDNATNTNVSDVGVNQYGCGYGQLGGFGFGYGYGYGYGGSNSKFEGRQISLYPCNVNGHNFGGSGSSSSSSSSGSGGGGGSGGSSSSSSSSGGGGGGGGGSSSSSSSSGSGGNSKGTAMTHTTTSTGATGTGTQDNGTGTKKSGTGTQDNGAGTQKSGTGTQDNGTTTTGTVGNTVSGTGNLADTYTPRTYDNQPKNQVCGTSDVEFSDIDGHPLRNYIIELEKKSGLYGVTSVIKSFGPDLPATRAEFLKMVIRSLCINYSSTGSIELDHFSDSGLDDWQIEVINKGVKLGWVSTDNPSFRPNDPISRIEALKMLMQAAGVPLMTPLTSSFADVPVGSWMARYTERAKYLDIVHGQMIDGQLLFRPDDGITRAESAKVIMRTLFPGWL